MEEFDLDLSTQGAAEDGFVDIIPDKISNTKTKGDEEGSHTEGMIGREVIPKALESLEKHSAFTASVVALIGYIAIASFGRMTNYADYLRYILFLLLIYVLYRLLKIELQKFVMKKKDWILLGICIFLALFIFIEHYNQIVVFFTKLGELLKESSIPEKEISTNILPDIQTPVSE